MKSVDPERFPVPTYEQGTAAKKALSSAFDNLYTAHTAVLHGYTTVHTRIPREDIMGLKNSGSLEHPSVAVARPRKGTLVIDNYPGHFAVTRNKGQHYTLFHANSLVDFDYYPDGFWLSAYDIQSADDVLAYSADQLCTAMVMQEPTLKGVLTENTHSAEGVQIANQMAETVNGAVQPNRFKTIVASLVS